MPLIDISGQRFATFTVQQRVTRLAGSRAARWLVRCDCGAETTTRGEYLRHDRTRCPQCSTGRKPTKNIRQRDYSRQHRATFSSARRHAQRAVQSAVYGGILAREPCEACGKPAEAHHDDYAAPLEVRWLCRSHHRIHHNQFGPGKNA